MPGFLTSSWLWLSFLWLSVGKLPSGEHTKNYGKSPFLMEKSSISMAIFNSYVTNYQRVLYGTFITMRGQCFGQWPTGMSIYMRSQSKIRVVGLVFGKDGKNWRFLFPHQILCFPERSMCKKCLWTTFPMIPIYGQTGRTLTTWQSYTDMEHLFKKKKTVKRIVGSRHPSWAELHLFFDA
jgi:hypothetical protein